MVKFEAETIRGDYFRLTRGREYVKGFIRGKSD